MIELADRFDKIGELFPAQADRRLFVGRKPVDASFADVEFPKLGSVASDREADIFMQDNLGG